MIIQVSTEAYAAIKAAAKANKNKRVAKCPDVLELRYEGKSNAEITEKTGCNARYITTLTGTYRKQGLDEYIRIKQTSHQRNMSEKDEAEVLTECEEEAEAGQILTAFMVREKLERKLGWKTGNSYVYRVLQRYGWRKALPKSKFRRLPVKRGRTPQKN